MLKKCESKNLSELKESLASRQTETSPEIVATVQNIINEVRKNQDKALLEFTKKFDGVELSEFEVSEEELKNCCAQVESKLQEDIRLAAENIRFFHAAQQQEGYQLKKENGVVLGQRVIPLAKVGVYVPGGRACYFSSVLMNIIPAKIAGVKEIIMVTPPTKQGSIEPSLAYAAKVAGVDKIYKIGGAQAIAALAYGTESIPQVDKITGPGNVYVAVAKKLVYGQVDIDMIAGPSEILVIADEKANPEFVAADLLSQAEHDPMASAILISPSTSLIDAVNEELRIQTERLPKKEIVKTSLANYGVAYHCQNLKEAVEIANQIAPEHLELMVENPWDLLERVRNAGSVFLGYNSCESIGDYFGGVNHVLPTNGTARFFSPLSCDSFIKKSSYLYYSKEALAQDQDKIINMAINENLEAHANAARVRVKSWEK